jgi:predicted CoA-substrate-specific enzyme activase
MGAVIGIDLGSRTTKIVRMVDGEVLGFEIFDTGHDPLKKVERALSGLEPEKIMATGYGRHLLGDRFGAECVTEIKACARGVHELYASCKTILDVGGQDCKVVHLDEQGRVAGFDMNDRCAAGTGRFLEVMAGTFALKIDDFVEMAMRTREMVAISSMCTVFAESEVVSLITSGHAKEKIARGLHHAIASRLHAMLSGRPLTGETVFIGGGARNHLLHAILEEKTKIEIARPENPQIVTATGAALLAAE